MVEIAEPQGGLRCEGKILETLAKVCHIQEHRDNGIHIKHLRKKECRFYTKNIDKEEILSLLSHKASNTLIPDIKIV